MKNARAPIGQRHGPSPAYVPIGEVHQLLQCGVVGEHALVLGYLPYLAVVALHGVGGVYEPADGWGELEVLGEAVPVVTPGLDDYGIV